MAIITFQSFPLISACHISLRVRILALIIQFHGFPLLSSCLCIPETIISGLSEIFEGDNPPFLKFLHRGLAFVPIIIALLDNPRDDGIECRLIDDVLTKYHFHRFVRLNRRLDHFRTPCNDRDVIHAFVGVWECAVQITCTASLYNACSYMALHRNTDDTSKLPDPKPFDIYRQRIIECLQNTAGLCEVVDRYREAVDHYKTPAGKRSDSGDKQYCNELDFQVKAFIERVEGLQDRLSKMRVWKRTWCQPLVEDFNQGLNRFYVDTTAN